MSTTATEALFEVLSPAIQRSVRKAVLDGRQTVGEDWGRRLHAEAQGSLGANGSPFESAVHQLADGGFDDPVYVLTDEIRDFLSA